MDYLSKIIGDIEIHSVEGIKECFSHGVDPNGQFKDQPLIYELINEYLRSAKFKECVKAFIDHGLVFNDKALLAVLLDDAHSLEAQLKESPGIINHRYTFHCTFTPLYEASLLHICAEYGHLECAKCLVKNGIDVNVKAGIDKNGFGGQTPIFHTVNQPANNSLDVLKFLVGQHADLTITVDGLIWGEGYEWETYVPSVNPVSYSMMGLLRQFQRGEGQIYEVVNLLMKAKYGIDYTPTNVPNKYLNS